MAYLKKKINDQHLLTVPKWIYLAKQYVLWPETHDVTAVVEGPQTILFHEGDNQ